MQRFATLALLLAMVIIAGCSSDDGTPAVPRMSGPSDLSATALSSTSVRLRWTDNSFNENGFRIERAPAGADNWTVVDTTDIDVVTFTETGLTEGTAYQYRVSAFIGRTNSTPAGPVRIATPLVPPSSRPTVLRLSETSLKVTWVDASTVETGYVVERRSSGVSYAQVAAVAADSVSFIDEGLTPATLYYYHVKAIKDTISSVWSVEGSARTTVLRPLKPENLVSIAGPTRPNAVRLTWDDVAGDELGYVVEKSLTGNSDWTYVDSLTENKVFADITNLTAEVTIFFRIYAWNQYGNSAYSNVTSSLIVGPPNAATNLVAVAPNYHAVLMTWTDNAQTEQSYRVERRPNPGTSWTPIVALEANATQYNDSSAIPNKSYGYRVVARNESGDSQPSNEAIVTVPNGPPASPRPLDALTNDIDKIRIFWRDNSTDEDGYHLERMGPGDVQFATIALLDSNTTQFVDTALTPESQYYYRVRGHNTIGFGDYSNVDSAWTASLTVFADDFETYDLNTAPGAPWSMNAHGSSWMEVTNTNVKTGVQSLQVHDNEPIDTSYVTTFARHAALPKGKFSMWLYLRPNSYFGILAGDNSQSGTITWQIQFNSDNSFYVRNGLINGDASILENGGDAYPTNRWFEFSVEFDANTSAYTIFFDGVPAIDEKQFLLDNHAPVGIVAFRTYSGAQCFDAGVDGIEITRPGPTPDSAPTESLIVNPSSRTAPAGSGIRDALRIGRPATTSR